MYKGTSRLTLFIKEEVNTMQYDNSNIPDVGEVYGSITCKVMATFSICCFEVLLQAELEGCPDVQLILTVPTNSPPLDNFVIHSCVISADTNPIMMQVCVNVSVCLYMRNMCYV